MKADVSSEEWADSLCFAMVNEVSPMRTRGVRTRGGATSATAAVEKLHVVINRLLAQPSPVRIEVAHVLMKKGDDSALAALRALAVDHRDPDDNVRWTIAEGLGNVNHAGAVPLLEELARSDPDELVRARAIGTLGERARAAFSAKVGVEQATPSALTRTRGAIRTRGASPVRGASPEAQEILDLLERLREEEPSYYVQRMADLTLSQLGE